MVISVQYHFFKSTMVDLLLRGVSIFEGGNIYLQELGQTYQKSILPYILDIVPNDVQSDVKAILYYIRGEACQRHLCKRDL